MYNLRFNVFKGGQTVMQGPLCRSLLKEKSKVSVFFLLITYSWAQWQGAKLIPDTSHLNLLFGGKEQCAQEAGQYLHQVGIASITLKF